MVYPCEFDQNPTIGSLDRAQTRSDANADRICSKSNNLYAPSFRAGGITTLSVKNLGSNHCHNMSHLMTKPTKWLCAQGRLRSAWASTQSDQSLSSLSAWRNSGSLATNSVHNEDSYQTGRMPRHPASAQSDQSSLSAWRNSVLSYPLSAQLRLIRLGGCPGWSESSLGAQHFVGLFMRQLIQISPRKKALFFAFTPRTKILKRELSRCFYVSSRRPFLFSAILAEKFRELSLSFSAKFRAATPWKLRVISKNVNSLNVCFVWFVGLRPNQYLWSY